MAVFGEKRECRFNGGVEKDEVADGAWLRNPGLSQATLAARAPVHAL